MFEFYWLRKFIRRNTRKIPAQKAISWRNRFSVLYMLCAWHAFGLVVYMCYTGRQDWMKAGGFMPESEVPPARSWAHTLGVKNAKVIRVSGLTVDGTYEIREDDGWDYGNMVKEHQKKILKEKGIETESEESGVTLDN